MPPATARKGLAHALVAGVPILVDSDVAPPSWKVPHGVEWSGFLLVGAAGKYRFALDSDDGSELELDGEKVIKEERLLKGTFGRIRDVRAGSDGLLYLLTDESDGKLVRLEPVG